MELRCVPSQELPLLSLCLIFSEIGPEWSRLQCWDYRRAPPWKLAPTDFGRRSLSAVCVLINGKCSEKSPEKELVVKETRFLFMYSFCQLLSLPTDRCCSKMGTLTAGSRSSVVLCWHLVGTRKHTSVDTVHGSLKCHLDTYLRHFKKITQCFLCLLNKKKSEKHKLCKT